MAGAMVGCGGPRASRARPAAPEPGGTGAALVLPANAPRPLPVVIFLPPTFGSARWVAEQYFTDGRPSYFAAIILAGSGRPEDYSSAARWSGTVARWERQAFADLARLAPGNGLDTSRVYLAGFSMGGDLAWALALRNPARIAGAVVMGSRASYRASPADHQALAAMGRRFFFSLGEDEDPARLSGAQAAMALLATLGVEHRRARSGRGHAPATPQTFAEALRFVIGEDGR
jgi:pimeloyl-ACP methyl ester carboxylesterase